MTEPQHQKELERNFNKECEVTAKELYYLSEDGFPELFDYHFETLCPLVYRIFKMMNIKETPSLFKVIEAFTDAVEYLACEHAEKDVYGG